MAWLLRRMKRLTFAANTQCTLEIHIIQNLMATQAINVAATHVHGWQQWQHGLLKGVICLEGKLHERHSVSLGVLLEQSPCSSALRPHDKTTHF
jgi:hypothetical protein